MICYNIRDALRNGKETKENVREGSVRANEKEGFTSKMDAADIAAGADAWGMQPCSCGRK